MEKTIFSPADILLPDYAANDPRWSAWAAIACDQFTSEPEYWAEAEKAAAGQMTTLSLFLPEAYLGTEKEVSHGAGIPAAMAAAEAALRTYENSMIYLERTLPDGKVRRGLVGKIDLEAYDYAKGSVSPVRATEATVVERIPPRQAIRAAAPLELPHIMILIDDKDGDVIASVRALRDDLPCVYDFPLMQGGAAAKGYLLTGAPLDKMLGKIAVYEKKHAGGVVYAMGDGNHSLAAAKAHYESLKASLGDAALDHPARWALCEIVALSDEALVFEPIYRVVLGADRGDFLAAFRSATAPAAAGQTVTCVFGDAEESRTFTSPDHALTVGTLQNFIDRYVASHKGVKCDYIHDEASLRALAAGDGAVGFLLDGMGKEELFPYVTANGTLPRKTFSMGEARSKRYYLEARKITR